MALLNKKFDVLRGWPREGAIDETFAAHVTSGTVDSLPQGSIVMFNSDGSVQLATTPTTTKPVFVVVEGNDDFSATFLKKVVCLRGNCVLQLEAANYKTGTYHVGDKLTYETATGKFNVCSGSSEQVIGEVWSAPDSNGLMVVYFNPTFAVA